MSLIDLLNKKSILPLESEALSGRDEEVEVPEEHFVKGTPLKGPFPENLKQACFRFSGNGPFNGVPFTKCSSGTSTSSSLPLKASDSSGRILFLFSKSINDIIYFLYLLLALLLQKDLPE